MQPFPLEVRDELLIIQRWLPSLTLKVAPVFFFVNAAAFGRRCWHSRLPLLRDLVCRRDQLFNPPYRFLFILQLRTVAAGLHDEFVGFVNTAGLLRQQASHYARRQLKF